MRNWNSKRKTPTEKDHRTNQNYRHIFYWNQVTEISKVQAIIRVYRIFVETNKIQVVHLEVVVKVQIATHRVVHLKWMWLHLHQDHPRIPLMMIRRDIFVNDVSIINNNIHEKGINHFASKFNFFLTTFFSWQRNFYMWKYLIVKENISYSKKSMKDVSYYFHNILSYGTHLNYYLL